MKIYKLTQYTFDWYCFEEFVVASKNKAKLLKYAKANNPHGYEIFDMEEDASAASLARAGQDCHFCIEPVELI